MDRAPQDVVAAYVEGILNGREPDSSSRLISNDALADRVATFRAAFPDLDVVVRQIVVQHDLVAIHLVGHGTHRGPFQGIPATGRAWSATCTAIYRVQDGGIVDFWINWDVLGILEQIGGVARVATASA